MTGTGASEERFRRAFILLFLLLVTALFIGMIRSFLTALLLAAVFTALLYPIQRPVCHAFGKRRHLAATVVLTGAVLFIGVPLLAALGLIGREALQISENATSWMTEKLEGDARFMPLPSWLPFREELAPHRGDILEKFGEAVSAIGSFLVGSIPDITRSTLKFFLDAFIFLYAMFVFLADGPFLLEAAKKYVPLQESDRDHIVERGFRVARAALKGILVIGVLEGIAMWLAFKVIGIAGAAFWGALVVILSAIPAVGAPLVWGPAAIYLIATGETWWAVALVAWGIIVIGGIDNILRPIVVGHDARMPDLLILVATLGGITMFGAVGIIVGPILAAVVITALEIYQRAFAPALSGVDGKRARKE